MIDDPFDKMNILIISSILPIPGIRKTNDFVFQLYGKYRQLYPKDNIVVITPLKLNLNPLSLLRGGSMRKKLKNNYRLNLQDFHIEVFPFISAWRNRNLHALLSPSVFYLNRRRIHKLFAENNFDIIHSRFIFADGKLASMLSKRYGIPYMITTHNERFYFDHWLSKSYALRILRRASFVTPLSYANYQFFKSLGIDNLERSTHGFSTSFIKTQKLEERKTVKIFTVAELIKLKNIDKVVEAIGALVPEYDILYTIIGRGPEKEALVRLVESLGLSEYVTFLDQIPHDEIAAEMHSHDIFIMPSYFETFGRVYFEVMAMGIPIICAKNSGIYGVFREGVEGLSVDHTNLDDIVSALELLVSDRGKRLEIGRAGQSLVDRFTWENIAKDMHGKYLKISS